MPRYSYRYGQQAFDVARMVCIAYLRGWVGTSELLPHYNGLPDEVRQAACNYYIKLFRWSGDMHQFEFNKSRLSDERDDFESTSPLLQRRQRHRQRRGAPPSRTIVNNGRPQSRQWALRMGGGVVDVRVHIRNAALKVQRTSVATAYAFTCDMVGAEEVLVVAAFAQDYHPASFIRSDYFCNTLLPHMRADDVEALHAYVGHHYPDMVGPTPAVEPPEPGMSMEAVRRYYEGVDAEEEGEEGTEGAEGTEGTEEVRVEKRERRERRTKKPAAHPALPQSASSLLPGAPGVDLVPAWGQGQAAPLRSVFAMPASVDSRVASQLAAVTAGSTAQAASSAPPFASSFAKHPWLADALPQGRRPHPAQARGWAGDSTHLAGNAADPPALQFDTRNVSMGTTWSGRSQGGIRDALPEGTPFTMPSPSMSSASQDIVSAAETLLFMSCGR